MIRMIKDGEVTVPSSEEYAVELEKQGWSYLPEPVEPKSLPEDFPMRAELAALGLTTTAQVELFLAVFNEKTTNQMKKALKK